MRIQPIWVIASNLTDAPKTGAVVQLAPNVPDEKVRTYLLAAVDLLKSGVAKVKEALQRIESGMQAKGDPSATILAVQLLAFRRYIRKSEESGCNLDRIWGWTEEEAKQNRKVEPSLTLYAEAEKVKRYFKQSNPGYELRETPLRSVERQVTLWIGNRSVREAGAFVLDKARQSLAMKPDDPTGASLREFKDYLAAIRFFKNQKPSEPTNAAPGLSDHGRGLAVDFQVFQSGNLKKAIASIRKKTIKVEWASLGWDQKLAAACARTRLAGPLQNPYEPWHWCLK